VVFEQRDVEVQWLEANATTWSCKSISMASWAHPGARAPCASSSTGGRHHHPMGMQDGYFADQASADNYAPSLKHCWSSRRCLQLACLVQRGYRGRATVLSCFINSVEDTMESILGLAKRGHAVQVRLGHRYESVTHPLLLGNYSTGAARRRARQLHEGLRCVRGRDQVGRQDRRAAKMVILNIDSPDIEEFIRCKAKEERRRGRSMRATMARSTVRPISLSSSKTPTTRCG